MDHGTANRVLIIEPGRAERHYWGDLWRYRELLWMLSWRDVVVRYKQTVLGIGWAVLRPFLTMVVFTLIFGHLANLPSHDVPYGLMVFAGVLPWQFFSSAFADASNSLVSNASMIAKISFPRMIVPASAVLAALMDFALAGLVYALISVWYGFMPGWQVAFLPAFFLLLCVFVAGCGLWASALNVSYRDVRYLIPFVIQLGTYISPVGFSTNIVPEQWRMLYALNPMVGIIDGFRWCLLGGNSPIAWEHVGLSVILSVLVLIMGIRVFRRLERSFADMI